MKFFPPVVADVSRHRFCLAAADSRPLRLLGLLLALLTSAGAETLHRVPNLPLEVAVAGVGKAMQVRVDSVIAKQLKLSAATGASAPLADDLAFFVQSRYHQEGYAEALASWELTAPSITLTVVEGPRYALGKITCTGVDPATEAELRPYLTSPTQERQGTSSHLPYVLTEIQAGAGLMQRKLRANGYLDALVAEPVVTPEAATHTMSIALAITQGAQFTFGEVSLTGDTEQLSPEVIVQVQQLSGQPFNEVTLETLRQAVATECVAHGYFAPTVTAEHPAVTTQQIRATLHVELGELFHVDEVRVSGDFAHGPQRVANAVFRPAIGSRYEPGTLDLFTRRALETGLYGRLEVTPTVVGPGALVIDVSGTEAKPKTLGFFGGYDTFTGPILGSEFRHVNFMDSGDTAGIKAQWSARGLEGRLQWIDPALFGTRNALAIDLYAETFSFLAYERHTAALRAALSRRFSRHVSAEVFGGISLNQAISDDLLPYELGPEEYTEENLGARLLVDHRDNPLIPHQGWLTNVSAELVSGEVMFGKFDLTAALYHPLNKHWRVAAGLRSSLIYSGGDIRELPIDQRNFNGGGNSVRSFKDRLMGPRSLLGETPLGDFAATTVNAELSYEVISNLELAMFVDAGSLGETSDAFRFANLRYAVGLGVRYNLPIGPLRMDYGFNPDRHPGEALGALHVTFGFAF